MKKTIALLLSLCMCFTVSACGINREGKERIRTAQEAINALHKLNQTKSFYDTLYLTEDAQIHHNEWSIAYLDALAAYEALSEEEKAELYNPTWIYESESCVSKYEDLLIQQEIVLYCKDIAVEEIKDSLINKSSYEEYSWIIESSNYKRSNGTFSVKYEIEYSATNRLGGRIDDISWPFVTGTYQNGEITITKVSH